MRKITMNEQTEKGVSDTTVLMQSLSFFKLF